MSATSAQVQFTAGGLARVEANLRLIGDTLIDCFTYGDRAPILSIDDRCVRVTITVAGADRVTADDVACARRLAEAVARYADELGTLAAAPSQPEPRAQAAGRAA